MIYAIGTHVAGRTPLRKAYRTGFRLDDAPGRCRIGLPAPANALIVERDSMNLRPGDAVMIFTTRIPFEQACAVESRRRVAPRRADAGNA